MKLVFFKFNTRLSLNNLLTFSFSQESAQCGKFFISGFVSAALPCTYIETVYCVLVVRVGGIRGIYHRHRPKTTALSVWRFESFGFVVVCVVAYAPEYFLKNSVHCFRCPGVTGSLFERMLLQNAVFVFY